MNQVLAFFLYPPKHFRVLAATEQGSPDKRKHGSRHESRHFEPNDFVASIAVFRHFPQPSNEKKPAHGDRLFALGMFPEHPGKQSIT